MHSASCRPARAATCPSPGVASGTGSPHLTDQVPLFENFEYRDINFNQPGTTESPRPGVTISRDEFGVPSITGETEDDAWFGVGYAVAQDRLFQLELFRRATSGRLSEIVGPGYLDDDLIARRDYYTDAEVQAMMDEVPQRLVDRTQSLRGRHQRLDRPRAGPRRPRTCPASSSPSRRCRSTTGRSLDSARVGIFLARTVPSSDGGELRNALALADAGPKAFNRLLPVRTQGPAADRARLGGQVPRPARPHQGRPAQGLPASPASSSPSRTSRASWTRRRQIPRAASGGAASAPTSPARACAASSPAPADRSCGRCTTRDRRAGLPLQRPAARLLGPGALRRVRAPLPRAPRDPRRQRRRRAR